MNATSKQSFDDLLQDETIAMVIHDDMASLNCNQAFVDLFGANHKDELLGLHPSQLSPEYQANGSMSYVLANEHIQRCLDTGSAEFDWLNTSLKGQLILSRIQLKKLSDNRLLSRLINPRIYSREANVSGSDTEMLFTVHNDVSFWESFDLLNQHKRAIDVSAIVSKTDRHGVITYVNDMFCTVSGYSRTELIGHKHNIVNHPDMPKSVFANIWATITAGEVWSGVIQNRRKDGSSYYVSSTISPIMDAHGDISEFIAIRHDITDVYEKDRIIKIQTTDRDTGLANRVKFNQDLRQRSGAWVAVLQLPQIDGVQQIYGDDDYQSFMQALANKLRQYADGLGTVYRTSDSYFALMCQGSTDQQVFINNCRAMIDKLCSQPVVLAGSEIFLTSRIGLAENTQPEKTYGHACLAMNSTYQSEDSLALYHQGSEEYQRLNDAIYWAGKLRTAVAQGHIRIHGQGLFNAEGQRYSTEVLMRYQSENECVSPVAFLDHAKVAGIYNTLTQEVIRQSFAYFNGRNERFSINLDQEDIFNNNTRQFILAQLAHSGCGEYLTVELLESSGVDFSDQRVRDFLREMKSLGCQIAIDDFGSGYSNFEYLASLEVDLVKIDGSLIRDVLNNEKHYLIVRSIVYLCKSLQIKVVAEFTENKDIVDLLAELKVDYFQGYYFEKPKLIGEI